MNFLPERLLEQLELKSFIKKAMYLLGIAFFIGLLLVFATHITMGFYRRALAEHEANLVNQRFAASDALSAAKREAEEYLQKQNRLQEAAGIESLEPADARRIINALPEALSVWELSLLASLRQGELQGIAIDTDAVAEFTERLKEGGQMESVQLARLHKYSEDKTDFTVIFQWKEGVEP